MGVLLQGRPEVGKLPNGGGWNIGSPEEVSTEEGSNSEICSPGDVLIARFPEPKTRLYNYQG